MHDSVNDNLQSFQRIFLGACSESDVNPKNISIVAVSKKKDISLIRAVYENGFGDFGENFAQELSEKSNQLKDLDIVWHYIGPIQSNKVKLVAAHAHWVHSCLLYTSPSPRD